MISRRNVIQKLALGLGLAGTGIPSFAKSFSTEEDDLLKDLGKQSHNMCGFAAPKIDKVRIGIIGLGNRGNEAVRRLSYLGGVEIVAICDKYKDKVDEAQKVVLAMQLPKVKEFFGSEDGWKGLCDLDIDLVYICTPWHLHTPMSVYAMKAGKHAATEVPAAANLEECWQLVETSEKTKKHCMMLENCCYDDFEMLTLNMTRNGLFGELIHAEGAYIHDLMDLNFSKTYYADYWRLKENANHNGSLYPTHGLGPIAQCLDINRGDKMDYLVSVSTADFMMHQRAEEESLKNPDIQKFTKSNFRGNMNTTTIKTAKGKSIMIQHDVTSPRPYSRIHLLSGTKGMAQKYPSPERIAFGHKWIDKTEMDNLYKKYTPPVIEHIGKIAKEVGGHGGMDFVMDWRLIDCLRNGLALDQDVYDAAAWSSISILSQNSVAKRSKTMDIPDFTRGSWKNNKPVDLTLSQGATTQVRDVKIQESKM